MYLEPHDYWIYHVTIGLCHKYGISAAESQMLLHVNRPRRRRVRRNGCFCRLVMPWQLTTVSKSGMHAELLMNMWLINTKCFLMFWLPLQSSLLNFLTLTSRETPDSTYHSPPKWTWPAFKICVVGIFFSHVEYKWSKYQC